MEDVEKLVSDHLCNLKVERELKDALGKEVDQVRSSPFSYKIKQTAPPRRFMTHPFTPFKGDSDPESNLKHYKSVVILYKAEDALICKVFAMTLRGAIQDWFHTMPPRSISSFRELAIIFTKEYTICKMIKKQADDFNLKKKYDYIKRLKEKKANIMECDD